jgi:hypothetical protein
MPQSIAGKTHRISKIFKTELIFVPIVAIATCHAKMQKTGMKIEPTLIEVHVLLELRRC